MYWVLMAAGAVALLGLSGCAWRDLGGRVLSTPEEAAPTSVILTATPVPTEREPIVVLDTPKPTVPINCMTLGGTLAGDRIPSEILPDPIDFMIYLPPCYQYEPNKTYPVVYLIHGQSFNEEQWERMGAVKVADAWIKNREAPSFLIVMPYVADWKEPSAYPFGQALVEELLPYVEETYRAEPARGYRKIGGVSRGAAWALNIGIRNWHLFSAIGGHSLPIFWDDSPYVSGLLGEIPMALMPQFYLDYSEGDQSAIKRSTNWLMEELDRRSIPYFFTTGPGGHTEEYWAGNIEAYMSFYLAGW